MVAHPLLNHPVNRQLPGGVDAPTAAGITDSAIVIDPSVATTASSLAFDSAAPTNSISAPPLAVTSPPFTSSTPTQSSSSNKPSASIEAASGASRPIALSTVIGTCVGAFIGAAAFIFLAFWFYRRYSRSLKQRRYNGRGGPRSPLSNERNARGEVERRRSRLEAWNKLEDEDDKWDGMYKPKEMDTISPMEKLTVFKKSPSATFTRKSDETSPPFLPHHPYSQYHLNDSHDLPSGHQTPPQMPEPRHLLGREPQNLLGNIDSGPNLSWSADSHTGQAAYLSATRLSGGAMSPTLNMAIPTPPATISEPHRWESAEVVHFAEGQSAEIIDPYGSSARARESSHNPFFNAQSTATHKRSGSRSSSRSRSTRSRSNSTVTVHNTANKGKEKERVTSVDPFSDPFPKPSFIHHLASDSSSSSASNERAIKLLVAALDDVSEEEIQRRLRVASMQPSIISNGSMYTDADPEEVTRSFPLPPSSKGHAA